MNDVTTPIHHADMDADDELALRWWTRGGSVKADPADRLRVVEPVPAGDAGSAWQEHGGES